MRIAVFGAGAIGGYFGALLIRAGQDLSLVARGANLRAIRNGGLVIEGADEEFVARPRLATDDPAEIGPVDAVLLGVKVWQVPDAARAMGPLLGPDTCILPLQNGVETPTLLSREIGERHVLGGVCKVIVNLVSPGRIVHIGVEPQVSMGELDNRSSERTDRLAEILRDAGCQIDRPESIQVAMWEKFLFISTVSGVGAVTRSPVGVLREMPETHQMLRDCMTEIYRVGRAHGVPLDDDVVERWMRFLDTLPANATASMQRDLMEGRPSELDAQNGAVVRLGAEAGVPTPLNTFIYHSLLPTARRPA